jgi:hypothetical protein
MLIVITKAFFFRISFGPSLTNSLPPPLWAAQQRAPADTSRATSAAGLIDKHSERSATPLSQTATSIAPTKIFSYPISARVTPQNATIRLTLVRCCSRASFAAAVTICKAGPPVASRCTAHHLSVQLRLLNQVQECSPLLCKNDAVLIVVISCSQCLGKYVPGAPLSLRWYTRPPRQRPRRRHHSLLLQHISERSARAWTDQRPSSCRPACRLIQIIPTGPSYNTHTQHTPLKQYSLILKLPLAFEVPCASDNIHGHGNEGVLRRIARKDMQARSIPE